MIKDEKRKTREDGSELIAQTYGNMEFKGPFINFLRDEYKNKVYITFNRAYAEDSKYENKTYMQLVVEALDEIEKSVDAEKKIVLKEWGKSVEIPRGTDKFEIQTILSNFIIKNTEFNSTSKANKKEYKRYNEEVSNETYEETKFTGPFLDYVKTEYPETIYCEFNRAYAEDSKYADKTYLQLVVNALDELDKTEDMSKKIYLMAWGKTLEIPRDTDRFEIQELLINFTLKNATFYSKKIDEKFTRNNDNEMVL